MGKCAGWGLRPPRVFSQSINGERILYKDNIPWVKSSESNQMVGWNFVSLSGNDHFYPYPTKDLYEEWYAIDDVYIRAGNGLPEGLE